MKYGVYIPPFGPYADPKRHVSLAQDAEAAGWDGYFMWDHIAMWWGPNAHPVVEAWVTLTAVAATTEHITIGPMVTPIPRRRPWKLARETASLDHLSNGRLVLGVGIGGGAPEFDDLGEEADLKKRGRMLDEGLDILTGLWEGEPVQYEGEFYHIERAHFTPPPVQTPRIPVWVAGFWPNKPPFRRAARWDGVFPLRKDADPPRMSPDDIREMMAYIQEHRTIDTPFDVVVSGGTPGDRPAEAAAAVAPYIDAGATWWFESIDPWGYGWREEGPWPLEAMRERVLAGPPTS